MLDRATSSRGWPWIGRSTNRPGGDRVGAGLAGTAAGRPTSGGGSPTDRASIIGTTVATGAVVLVNGEIVPRASGLGNAERSTVRRAPAVRVVEVLLWPEIVISDSLTRGLIGGLMAEPAIERPYLD